MQLSESIGLLLFLLQQFGVMLGVGASTFALIFYIVGRADGFWDASEEHFMRIVYGTLRISLFFILTTGLFITAAHYFAGDTRVITEPSYLFKWILLAIIIITAALMDMRILPSFIGGAIAGGTWYALFIVHTLSLSLTWPTLLSLYAAWLLLFWIVFTALRRSAMYWYAHIKKQSALAVSSRTSSHK